MVPVVVAVIAGVIGALLWRLFKVALQVVVFVVFMIVCVGVLAWSQPELFGRGKRVVEDQFGSTFPDVNDAKVRLGNHIDGVARDAVESQKKSFFPSLPTEPTP